MAKRGQAEHVEDSLQEDIEVAKGVVSRTHTSLAIITDAEKMAGEHVATLV